jgi:hypothetical protein
MDLPLSVLSQIGFGTLIVILVATGVLIPWRTQKRIEKLYADRLADRDARIVELVETNKILDQRADLQSRQIGELIDGVRTSNAVVSALPAARREGV